MARVTQWLAVLLVAAIFATSFAIGCIRRYPAPTTPVTPEMPYSAIVTWRGLTLPGAGEQAGEALPEPALRLALGPGADDVFADSSLVDESDQVSIVDDDLGAALETLAARTEDIVVLVDESLWPAGESLCPTLRRLGDRVHVAVGVSGHAEDGPARRPSSEAGSSRDPLSRAALEALCPQQTVREEQPPDGAP